MKDMESHQPARELPHQAHRSRCRISIRVRPPSKVLRRCVRRLSGAFCTGTRYGHAWRLRRLGIGIVLFVPKRIGDRSRITDPVAPHLAAGTLQRTRIGAGSVCDLHRRQCQHGPHVVGVRDLDPHTRALGVATRTSDEREDRIRQVARLRSRHSSIAQRE
jgi:hypothetical protein